MNENGTTGTGMAWTPDAACMERVIKDLGDVVKAGKWTVIDPQGQVYQGNFAEIFSLLASRHPLMQRPGIVDVSGA